MCFCLFTLLRWAEKFVDLGLLLPVEHSLFVRVFQLLNILRLHDN